METLVDYRNAIGHGDEARITAIEAGGSIRSTKQAYQHHRRSLDGLAGTVDEVVAQRLAGLLGIVGPW